MFKNYSLNRLLALFASLGFALLAIDSAIEHRDIFSKEPFSLVPVMFGALGAILAAFVVLKWSAKWIRILQMFLFVSFVVAAAGFYFHVKEEDDDEATQPKIVQEQKEKEKPIIAPLAFAGVAAIGLLGTARKWEAEVIKP
jgi:hypothetical protein